MVYSGSKKADAANYSIDYVGLYCNTLAQVLIIESKLQ